MRRRFPWLLLRPRIRYRAFFRGPVTPETVPSRPRDASRLMVVPLSITAGLGLLLGLGDLFGVYDLASTVGASVAEVTP